MSSFEADETKRAKGSQKSAPNREELLNLAISAAKSGNREGARVMFRRVLSENRYDERAVMWLAKLAPSKAERRSWLKRALEINPENDVARDTLRKMQKQDSATENRTLLIYGALATVLIVLAVVVVLVLFVFSGS